MRVKSIPKKTRARTISQYINRKLKYRPSSLISNRPQVLPFSHHYKLMNSVGEAKLANKILKLVGSSKRHRKRGRYAKGRKPRARYYRVIN